jgi:hypothetical protein
MIASKAHLDFMAFVHNLTPIIILVLIAYIITLKFIFGRRMTVKDELKKRIMGMDEREAIKDPLLLKKSLFVLALTITGFVFHGTLHMEPATIALFGAALLLLVSGNKEPHHILAEAEWTTLFFFAVDVWTGLEIRYSLQALPLLSLFSGAYLSRAFSRSALGKAAAVAALGYMGFVGVRTLFECIVYRYH